MRIIYRENFKNFFQMAMFFLPYVVTLLAQLHSKRNYFFTVNTFAEQLLLQNNQFDAKLLSRSNYLFRAATFLEHVFFLLSSYSIEIVSLFRAKFLPTSYFLRMGSSLGQLVFQNNYSLGKQICSEYRYLQKSFFFEAGTSTKHQIFQNSCFFNKVTWAKWALFQNSYFSRNVTFNVTSTFTGELLFQSSFFLKRAIFLQYNISEEVSFYNFTSFSQLRFLFIRQLLKKFYTSYRSSFLRIDCCSKSQHMHSLFNSGGCTKYCRTATFLSKLLIQSLYILRAAIFSTQLFLRRKYAFSVGTISKQLLFHV